MTSVRRGTAGDLPALLPVIREFYEVDGHDYDEPHLLGALEPLLAESGDALGQVWLAVDTAEAEAIVGYAVLTWGWGLESGGREGLLDEIYVSRRGTGVGSVLMKQVLAAARDAGCRTLFLETEAPNDAARRFYARHGLAEQDSVWMSTQL